MFSWAPVQGILSQQDMWMESPPRLSPEQEAVLEEDFHMGSWAFPRSYPMERKRLSV